MVYINHLTQLHTCQKNIIDKSHKHWHQYDLYKQVEDVHYLCHHKEIREAARVYSCRSRIGNRSVKLRVGKYKGTLLNQMSNFAYLQALIHHQRENHQYSEIHEYLCSKIETQPECISFGVYKGQRYDQLPFEYRHWCYRIIYPMQITRLWSVHLNALGFCKNIFFKIIR